MIIYAVCWKTISNFEKTEDKNKNVLAEYCTTRKIKL